MGRARRWGVVPRSVDVACTTAEPMGNSTGRTRVVTASHDRTARIWSAHTQDLLATAGSRVAHELTAEEREARADLLGDDGLARNE